MIGGRSIAELNFLDLAYSPPSLGTFDPFSWAPGHQQASLGLTRCPLGHSHSPS